MNRPEAIHKIGIPILLQALIINFFLFLGKLSYMVTFLTLFFFKNFMKFFSLKNIVEL